MANRTIHKPIILIFCFISLNYGQSDFLKKIWDPWTSPIAVITPTFSIGDNYYLEYSFPDYKSFSHFRFGKSFNSIFTLSIGAGWHVFDLKSDIRIIKLFNKFPILFSGMLGANYPAGNFYNISLVIGLFNYKYLEVGITPLYGKNSTGKAGFGNSDFLTEKESYYYNYNFHCILKPNRNFHLGLLIGINNHYRQRWKENTTIYYEKYNFHNYGISMKYSFDKIKNFNRND